MYTLTEYWDSGTYPILLISQLGFSAYVDVQIHIMVKVKDDI